MFEEKIITLNIYEADNEGKPLNYSTTSARQPKDDCISVIISLKESMQIDKLRIVMNGLKPHIEHAEELNEVIEGEFGLELVKTGVKRLSYSESTEK